MMCLSTADFKESASSLSRWTSTLCLAFVVWTPVQGEVQVICSTQPIIAAPGDDVILPCHLEPFFDVQDLTVEWSNPDLEPDPSDRLRRVEYVHLYRQRKEEPDMTIPSYVKRTKLFVNDLKSGNISLKIMNVTLADDGRYRCYIPKLGGSVKEAVVRLVVDPKLVKSRTTEASLLPTNPPRSDPQGDAGVNGGRSRLAFWIPLGVFLGFVVSLGVFIFKDLRPEGDLSEGSVTNSQPSLVSVPCC